MDTVQRALRQRKKLVAQFEARDDSEDWEARMLEIEKAAHSNGIENIDIKQQINPAWTTDWISERGKKRLLSYGIAPPNPSGGPKSCPQCGAADVERISQFGSTPCKAQWRCQECLEPFDYFKCL